MLILQGEIYLGCIEQDIGLPSILRHATVYSTQEEYKIYFKNLKENQIFPDRHAVYVCPAAFYDKRMLFFDLDWSTVHKGTETDFDGIIKYIFEQVELNTKPRGRKRKRVCIPDSKEGVGDGLLRLRRVVRWFADRRLYLMRRVIMRIPSPTLRLSN